MLIGLAALVASLTVVGGLMLGVLAAILGLIARVQVKHGQASNGDVAITGVVLGVLAIVASMIIALFWVVPQMRIINSEARITSIASVTNRETSKLASDIAGKKPALVVAALQTPGAPTAIRIPDVRPPDVRRVENVDHVGTVAGHDRHTDARSPIQLARTRLGRRHAELALQFGDDGTDHRTLFLERSHVAQQHVEFEPADPHLRRRGFPGAWEREPAAAQERAVGSAAGAAGLAAAVEVAAAVVEVGPEPVAERAGAGGGAGAGGVDAGELSRASSISAVRRDNCQPPWKGVNSIGNVNAWFGWAVLTRIEAITLDGFLSDQAMLSAANAMGR